MKKVWCICEEDVKTKRNRNDADKLNGKDYTAVLLQMGNLTVNDVPLPGLLCTEM